MTITTLPGAPSPTDDPSTFNSKAFALVAALPGFVEDANDLADEVEADRAAAQSYASAAAGSSTAAAAAAQLSASSAGAAPWVSGATYGPGVSAISPSTLYVYRRKSGGAGSTDPASDTANWVLASAGRLQTHIFTAVDSNTMYAGGHYVISASGQTDVALNPTATIGDVVGVTVGNGRIDNRVLRSGHRIMGLEEDMTINDKNASFVLEYLGASLGWRLALAQVSI